MRAIRWLLLIFISSILVSQGYSQPHSHGGRSHTHGLPSHGIAHRHGNGAIGVSSTPNKSTIKQSHTSSSDKYLKLGLQSYNQNNSKEAIKWFRKASQSGNEVGAHNLGLIYLQGMGVKKNPKEAFNWFRKAANKGYAHSEFFLGDLYVDGVGVRKSHKQALAWYKKAAAKNLPAAQYSVGAMYANGWGTAKNLKVAEKWFRKAADKGNKKAKKALVTLGINYKPTQKKRITKVPKNNQTRGTLNYGHGKYVGSILNNKAHGQGTYTSFNGKEKYIGNYVNGDRHGQGTLWLDNLKQVGIYKNGRLFNGFNYYPNGKKIKTVNGKQIQNTRRVASNNLAVKNNSYVDNSEAKAQEEYDRKQRAREEKYARWEREDRERERRRERNRASAAQWKSTMDTLTAMSNPSYYTGSTSSRYKYKKPSSSYSRSSTYTTPSYSTSTRSRGDSTFCKNGGSYRDRSNCISESIQNRPSWEISTVFKNNCSGFIKVAYCYSSKTTNANRNTLCSNSGNKPTQFKTIRGGGEAVHFASRKVNSIIGRKWVYDCKG